MLYNIFLATYHAAIRLAALWNPKARLWVNGRKTMRWKAESNNSSGNTIWMHCASLGEFEQGRPLLEAIRQQYAGCRIVLTFFSPSGYEVRKNYEGADAVYYLPMDGARRAAAFVEALNPALVLWVKYEYWYYYLLRLRQRNVPVLLVSGIFRPSQPFFKPWGGLWRQMLHCFTLLLVQNEDSLTLLQGIALGQKAAVTGDTRFDRVLQLAAQPAGLPLIETFCGSSPVIVAGSTWEEDEAELVHFAAARTGIKFIIAPHEIDAANIQDVRKTFKGAVLYSELERQGSSDAHILIIDNIGMLSRLYSFATVTYVGGGFGSDGVHNVLEAAVYGKPVLFGPEYEKYIEAAGLVDCGGAISISNALELEKVLNHLLEDEKALSAAGEAAGSFVRQHAGAVRKILDCIQEKRLLTS